MVVFSSVCQLHSAHCTFTAICNAWMCHCVRNEWELHIAVVVVVFSNVEEENVVSSHHDAIAFEWRMSRHRIGAMRGKCKFLHKFVCFDRPKVNIRLTYRECVADVLRFCLLDIGAERFMCETHVQSVHGVFCVGAFFSCLAFSFRLSVYVAFQLFYVIPNLNTFCYEFFCSLSLP